ncbi:MAG: hemerythrin domain-containing protein [Acidobacteriota bacterium]|nr:hemerythrin domain-containing protein [Acidobacteriota bacterium]
MTTVREELEVAFLEDHRLLTTGLERIAAALANDDLETAIEAADVVDQNVGPHMRFEEEEYYPRLRSLLGDAFVNQLYHEHGEGQEAIRRLVSAGHGNTLSPSAREEVAGLVKTALEHALSCGTLLSHLGSFDESEQRLLGERLDALRRLGTRWTEGVGTTG